MESNGCLSRGCPDISIENAEVKPCKKGNCNKLNVNDWLHDIPATSVNDIVEVRFKNTRKGFFRNTNELTLKQGDIVAVEASPGHDIGVVSLSGELVRMQLRKYGVDPRTELKKVYRKAKQADIEKWYEAISLEEQTMLTSREISSHLQLNMKIGDVEYQGDKTKAIFYYIADERVDFRELIKVLAEEFKVRIEMRQIGARQEAGRIGGIGSCGRELCCSTWITNFVSVTTNAARYQDVSLNPQKLAGQCGKLKCCLNYELDVYLDAQRNIPDTYPLETFDGTAYHIKTDVFRGMMWYSFDKDSAVNLTAVPVDRVREILQANKRGRKVKSLLEGAGIEPPKKLDYQNVVGQESLTRFEDKKKLNKNRNKKKKKKIQPNGESNQQASE